MRWPRVGEVVISQGKLSIKQKGKWLPWRVKDMSLVPNPHVLVALITEAKREHAGVMELNAAESSGDEEEF